MKKLIFTAVVSAALAGCAAPPEVKEMSIKSGVDISSIKSKGIKFKTVNVAGGGNTEFIMGSRVEKAGVQEALTETLTEFQLMDKTNGHYILDVDLKNCTAPFAGFVLDVNCEFNYKVISNSNASYSLSVESVGSANSLDGFNQYHLILRKANERAVRQNIKNFLERANAHYGSLK